MNGFSVLNSAVCLLKRSCDNFPDNAAYGDQDTTYTYRMTLEMAASGGTAIAHKVKTTKCPIAVYMEKNVQSIVSFWSILYSGNFYCPLDVEMPLDRIGKILDILDPKLLITDRQHEEDARTFCGNSEIILWEDMTAEKPDMELLNDIIEHVTENDPLYVLFTSGSTGIPKGVLVSHRVIINYLRWLDQTYSYDSDDVFGNQAPFYFDDSVHDIFGAAYFGAKMEIIPPYMFGFPIRLIQYMNSKKISTFLWVPSAMGIVAKLKTFRKEKPMYLKHVFFAGEVLPRKQLDYWVSNIPDAVYANLYGPTETFVCTAYTYNGDEPEGEPLPIGKAISNCEALILDDNGKPVPKGEAGELCLRGSCLSLGYYNNPGKTEASFVINPACNEYPERIYKTGDLVRLDETGNLIYLSRKDFQIKHMGYRIELGEIETAVSLIDGIGDCACVYDSKRSAIVLFYDGTESEETAILSFLEKKIPFYMMPGRIVYMKMLPHNLNGKIDRIILEKIAGE